LRHVAHVEYGDSDMIGSDIEDTADYRHEAPSRDQEAGAGTTKAEDYAKYHAEQADSYAEVAYHANHADGQWWSLQLKDGTLLLLRGLKG
jgi:hypothetical protein